jgi:hypothetical protein
MTPQGIFRQSGDDQAPPDASAAPPAADQSLPKIGGPAEPAPSSVTVPSPGSGAQPPAGPAPVAPPPAVAPPAQPAPAATPAPAAANPGRIQLTTPEIKPTETDRNRVIQINQTVDNLKAGLDQYAAMVKKTGIAAMPGQDRDNLAQLRTAILLQLKEANNLGVLNGRDYELMQGMLYDPVVDVTAPGGIGNAGSQALTSVGIGGSAGDRAQNSVDQLKGILENQRNAVLSNSPAAAAVGGKPGSADAYKKKYGLD